MIKVLIFLSNENCFVGHGLSTTALQYGVGHFIYNLRLDFWPFVL